jgi:lysophospholipase L1-like esterase
MKTILCYGDSLTWGYNPHDGSRYAFEQRWTGILQSELGSGVRIIEEALPGRTTITDSLFLPNRSGQAMLEPLLESHAPVDLCILMLGTNDVSPCYHLTAPEVALGCLKLIWMVQKSHAGSAQIHPHTGQTPIILLVAPPSLGEILGLTALHLKGGEETSRLLAQAYKTVADAAGCHFLDASQYIEVSKVDGVHLDPPANRILAMEIKKIVVPILASCLKWDTPKA